MMGKVEIETLGPFKDHLFIDFNRYDSIRIQKFNSECASVTTELNGVENTYLISSQDANKIKERLRS